MEWTPEQIDAFIDSLPYEEREQLPGSVPFDKFLWLESEKLDNLAEAMVQAFDTQRTGIRARKGSARGKMLVATKILLLNLLKLHKWPNRLVLGVPLQAKQYTGSSRYGNPELSYKTFKAVYDQFLERGWSQVTTRPYYDRETGSGMVTRLETTEKLRQAFDKAFPDYVFYSRHPSEQVIYLKDTKKRLMPYSDTEYTQNARENLRIINSVLSRHWYDLHISNKDFQGYADSLAAKAYENQEIKAAADLTERTLYRVYNNGGKASPESNFTQGGRYYGGWWEMTPSRYRKHITIDGLPTVEVDFSNLHPQMLYDIVGAPPKPDAYSVGNIHRPWVKTAFQQLLNGKEHYAIPKDFNPAKAGMTWEQIRQALREYHAPIADYFGTGYGLILQKQDSDLMEQILLHFCKRDIPCLPVHDSVIIQQPYQEELMGVMQSLYSQSLKGNISLKVEPVPSSPLPSDTQSLEEYSQYHHRQGEWQRHQQGV